WQQKDLTSLQLSDLQHLAAEYAQQVYDKSTLMGLGERQVKHPAINSAMTLLKSLKLVKQTSSGPRNVTVVKVSVTSLGSEILREKPEVGSIRIGLVGLLVDQSSPLRALLHAINEHGPISRPTASPRPGTPRKGAAFNRSLIEGLDQYM